MKLRDLLLCVSCNEVYACGRRACPSCASQQVIPLSRAVGTLEDEALEQLYQIAAAVSARTVEE